MKDSVLSACRSAFGEQPDIWYDSSRSDANRVRIFSVSTFQETVTTGHVYDSYAGNKHRVVCHGSQVPVGCHYRDL